MKKILSIVGARPQFIKHAPMQLQLSKYFHLVTIHTGQHYDYNMSDLFFKELGIAKPDYLFESDSAKSHGEKTDFMMAQIETVCHKELPDAMLVYGDTNSTLAGALVAAKMGIPLIHIEAGLRSYNHAMPEETNRIVADKVSSILFCPTKQAVQNLSKEGINHDKIFLCGDIMFDMVKLVHTRMKKPANHPYYYVTIHRPYNTDECERLNMVLRALNGLNRKVIFSLHPRTLERMKEFGIPRPSFRNIQFISPVGYMENISYQYFSDCVITDSGGMQKEAYMLKKKCLTLRSETEWTETLSKGWNILAFDDLENLQSLIDRTPGEHIADLYGDGQASKAIAKLIERNL